MLSQLRWMMGVAIGVIIMFAVWLDPEVPAPGGVRQPVRPPPSAAPLPFPAPNLEAEWPARLAAYRSAREVLIANTPDGPVREAALASLLQQYFRPEELAQAEALERAAGAAQRGSAVTPPAP